MKLLKIFFVLFLCVWLFATEGSKKCLALSPCSVRARFASSEANKGFSKCVCINRFYGKNCRFKVYNLFPQKEPLEANGFLENEARNGAWKLDASWHQNSPGSALIKLRLGDLEEKNDKVVGYRLTYRRVHYFEEEMEYGKWKKLTSFSINHTRSVLKLPKINVYNISLANAFSYEINLSTFPAAGKVSSTSVFLDSWNLARSGNNSKTSAFVEPLSLPTISDSALTNAEWLEWGPWSRCKLHSADSCGNGTQVRKRQCDGNICPGDKVEKRPCELTICSARFLHVTGIFEREGPNCFQNGIIIGGTVGSISTLILLVFVYIIIRRCKSTFHKRRSDLIELENPAFDENDELSDFKLVSVNTTSSSINEQDPSPRGSGFVSITIPECSGNAKSQVAKPSLDPVMIETGACSSTEDNEIKAFNRCSSVVITIAEDKSLNTKTTSSDQYLPVEAAAVITVDTTVQLTSSVTVDIPETAFSNGSPSETNSSKLALLSCLSHGEVFLEETPEENILTSEVEPGSVIVKIQDTDIDNMTVSSSMSSDESSTTSSSSVEAARAVLITIGTGDQMQTPAELP